MAILIWYLSIIHRDERVFKLKVLTGKCVWAGERAGTTAVYTLMEKLATDQIYSTHTDSGKRKALKPFNQANYLAVGVGRVMHIVPVNADHIYHVYRPFSFMCLESLGGKARACILSSTSTAAPLQQWGQWATVTSPPLPSLSCQLGWGPWHRGSFACSRLRPWAPVQSCACPRPGQPITAHPLSRSCAVGPECFGQTDRRTQAFIILECF